MLWDGNLIRRLLELYKENRVLWDPKFNNYFDKNSKEIALLAIKQELGIPLSTADIHRKYRTMRAAYQVEVRNISAAKIRGFFYKPSLHWFDIFHKFMEETKAIKANSSAVENERVKNADNEALLASKKISKIFQTDRYRKRRAMETPQRQSRRIPEPIIEEIRPSSAAEESSEESEDEFQTFADHVAEQLRTISTHRAVMIQNEIQRLFARDREMHEEEFIDC